MHIAILMDGLVPVQGYGGTERVATWLVRGLLEVGHQVTLIAARGSTMPGARVVEADLRLLRQPDLDIRPLLPSDADVVHSHRELRIAPAHPWIWTLHGNPPAGSTFPANTIFVSANHAQRYGGTRYVHNGLDPSEYQFNPAKKDFDLFLGRLHSIKGYKWAIAGAQHARRRLVLAGGWRPSLRKGIRYVGSVSGERKTTLLADARLLWMPALWDEPFGLTLIEALVSGTPVLGTHRGSLPEVITPDVGFLGDSVEELADNASRVENLPPEACRARVMERFTYRQMTEGYVREYERCLAGG